jgi:argininosuccinate lyase
MKIKSKLTEDFVSSFSFDQRLSVFDILGSIAHVKMLGKTRIILSVEAGKIIKGLNSILKDINNGKKIPKAEDIHYAIEKELIKRIGPIGGKMHTARSRNDQTALDLRLYARYEVMAIKDLLYDLIEAITKKAEKNIGVIMPGYTHLQHAQPVLFSHYILAYAWMFQRDIERLYDYMFRVNVMPLGSAALAGTSFPIDRNYTAKLLEFSKVSENSIDSVSDRDFVIEFLAVLSITATHLSRLSEELINWSSSEFDFIKLSNEFTTGSSIMPQKRNPDMAELVRGKTGKVYGNLMAILTVMKGLPLAYNRDMQEDKPPLFDAVDTIKDCLGVMAPMVFSMEIKPESMYNSTKKGFLCATELADYLTKKGMPFRTSHGIVKNIVEYCVKNDKELIDLSIKELKAFSVLFDDKAKLLLDPEKIVNLKKSQGGTSVSSVKKQIAGLKELLK